MVGIYYSIRWRIEMFECHRVCQRYYRCDDLAIAELVIDMDKTLSYDAFTHMLHWNRMGWMDER